MASVYVQRFTVTGRNPFPVDMLRYDGCFPDTSEDAVNIGSERYEPIGETRTVTLRRYVFHAGLRPTLGRWKSFGWEVSSNVNTRKL